MGRAGLSILSLPLRAATRLRLAAHRAGILPTVTLPAPVISVGNIAAGGTGKTPLVEHVVRELRSMGARPAVLARGYGPKVGDTGLNDEGCVLAENLPDLVQAQDPDRVAAGRRVLASGKADCLVLDDGFQHFRLARDLDIVAVDARDPFGGLLREGPAALRRAGAVVLTRASRAEAPAIEPAPLAVTDHEPLEASALRGRKVFAAAGIADPSSFLHTLESLGAVVVGSRWFPDHRMDAAGAAACAAEAERLGAEGILVTQKDAVKLRGVPFPVTALRIRLRFLAGEEALRGALRAALERGRNRAKP